MLRSEKLKEEKVFLDAKKNSSSHHNKQNQIVFEIKTQKDENNEKGFLNAKS